MTGISAGTGIYGSWAQRVRLTDASAGMWQSQGSTDGPRKLTAGVSLNAVPNLVLTSASGMDSILSAHSPLLGVRMPATSLGLPDFEAVISAGGTIKGAIPPDGSPMVQHVNTNGTVIEYSAVVDLGDGSPEFLLTGGSISASSTSSGYDREQLMTTLRYVLAELPKTLEQALSWSAANNWPSFEKSTGPINASLDATA